MTESYNPTKHHRRSIRLRGYDYTQAGAYFITICTQNHKCLFGNIVNGAMQLNDAGRTVETLWKMLPILHPDVEIDEFIVMPNHLHGIILISPIHHQRNNELAKPENDTDHSCNPAGAAVRIGDIVGAFKSRVTVEYIRGVKNSGWVGFDKRLLQRNYFEHIIRNQKSLNLIRQYIAENPQKWAAGVENRENTHFEDLSFVIDQLLIDEEKES
jgi:putative transposase